MVNSVVNWWSDFYSSIQNFEEFKRNPKLNWVDISSLNSLAPETPSLALSLINSAKFLLHKLEKVEDSLENLFAWEINFWLSILQSST